MTDDHDLAARIERAELPDGLREHEGVIQAECSKCGDWYEWPVDVSDFEYGDPNNACGKSQWCQP